MTSVGSLEEEASKRRERLKAMRDKSQKSEGEAKKQKTDEVTDAGTEALPKPVFRSYKPKDENLQVRMDISKMGIEEMAACAYKGIDYVSMNCMNGLLFVFRRRLWTQPNRAASTIKSRIKWKPAKARCLVPSSRMFR